MKTLLGFVVLVLYTFSMLTWGSMGLAQVCSRVAPPAHHHVPLPCLDRVPQQDASAPAIR